MEPLILFGATAVILLLVFALIGIKVILKPGSEFKKNCVSIDGDGSCSHCGRPSGEVCEDHDNGGCEDSKAESSAETKEAE